MSPTPPPPPAPLLAVPRVLWFALLASQAMYAVMIAVPGLVEGPVDAPDATVLVTLIAIATSCAIASFVVPGLVRKKALAAQRIELREVPDASAPVGFRGSAPTVREYADLAAVRAAARAVGFTPFILSLALSEAVSVIGFASVLVGLAPALAAPFLAVGMILTATRFPTHTTFFAPIEQLTGVPVPR